MTVCDIDSHDEQLDDGSLIAWPATSAGIPTDINHVILANRGDALTYTSTDGTQFVQFGSVYSATNSWVSSNGSFTSSGGTYYYDGPYASIWGAHFNADDDNFVDIEVLSTVDQFQDPRNGEFHHDPRSSPSPVGSVHLRDGVVAGPHLQLSAGGTLAASHIDTASVTEPGTAGDWAVQAYRTVNISMTSAIGFISGIGPWECAIANNNTGTPPANPSGAWQQSHRGTLVAGTSYVLGGGSALDIENPILDVTDYAGALINKVTFNIGTGIIQVQWQPIVVGAGSPGANSDVYLYFRLSGTPST